MKKEHKTSIHLHWNLNKRGCQKFCVQMEISTCSEYLAYFCYEYDKNAHKHIYVSVHIRKNTTIQTSFEK